MNAQPISYSPLATIISEAKVVIVNIAEAWSAADDPTYPAGLLFVADFLAEYGAPGLETEDGIPLNDARYAEVKEEIYHELFLYLRTLGLLVE